jgi:hypothetical protein
MSQPVLELMNASVRKGDATVLHDLTLMIGAGEHTAILGPNGAGKSVLVRLLTHEERALPLPHDASPVRVFGDDRWNVFELRPQLGIVSADLHQRFVSGNSEGRIPGLTAVLSGFIASQGILRYGAISEEMRRKAKEALETMGASHLAHRPMNEMSSGEARRVLLARALVTDPRSRAGRADDRPRCRRPASVHGARPQYRAARDDAHPSSPTILKRSFRKSAVLISLLSHGHIVGMDRKERCSPRRLSAVPSRARWSSSKGWLLLGEVRLKYRYGGSMLKNIWPIAAVALLVSAGAVGAQTFPDGPGKRHSREEVQHLPCARAGDNLRPKRRRVA